jgi:hypothetical protein
VPADGFLVRVRNGKTESEGSEDPGGVMKIEKPEEPGIFVRTIIEYKGIKGLHDALSAAAKRNIFDELKDWEDAARCVLRESGFDKFPPDLPESAPIEAKDARELIYAIMGTRDFIKKNNALSAATCAFRAGHIATRLIVRPHEQSARTGRKSLAFNALRREAKRKKGEKKRAAVIELYNEIKETYEPHELPKQKELINLTIEALQKKYRNRKYEHNTVKSVIYRSSHKTAK